MTATDAAAEMDRDDALVERDRTLPRAARDPFTAVDEMPNDSKHNGARGQICEGSSA